MTLITSDFNFGQSFLNFVQQSQDLLIISPFIKRNALSLLVDESTNCKTIVVRWKMEDIFGGFSDLEVYEFCKTRDIKLYRNSRIHLKVLFDGNKRCMFGSANITEKALGVGASLDDYNFEVASIDSNVSIENKIYFQRILLTSTLITDAVYLRLKDLLAHEKESFHNHLEFPIPTPEQDFLISSLPMSGSVEQFTDIYQGITDDTEDLNCFIHDVALYNIPLGLSKEKMLTILSSQFLSHPFIIEFVHSIIRNQGQMYFGEAKQWIQTRCADVPTPRKWEITKNIQILYSWLVTLGNGNINVDRPSFSERISVLPHDTFL